jgi:hypothetical protein
LVLGFRFFGYQVLGFLGGSGVLGFGGLAVARYRISLVVAADARRARVISASAGVSGISCVRRFITLPVS